MKWLIYSSVALLIIIFEGSLTTIPLIVGWMLYVCVSESTVGIFIFSFIAGLLIDSLTFHSLGSSSMFFSGMLFLVFLYQRKFEIRSVLFIFFATFFASLLYLFLFQSRYIFFPAVINALFASGLFGIIDVVLGKRRSINFQ